MAVLTPEQVAAKSPLDFVTANDWVLIKAGARQMKFSAGDAIIRQDSPGGTMFILRSGSVRVQAGGTTLARLGPGQICGEIAFLDNRPSSASVIAEAHVEADAIDWADLQRVFRMFPHLGSRFYQSLAVLLSRRLRETSARLAECQQG